MNYRRSSSPHARQRQVSAPANLQMNSYNNSFETRKPSVSGLANSALPPSNTNLPRSGVVSVTSTNLQSLPSSGLASLSQSPQRRVIGGLPATSSPSNQREWRDAESVLSSIRARLAAPGGVQSAVAEGLAQWHDSRIGSGAGDPLDREVEALLSSNPELLRRALELQMARGPWVGDAPEQPPPVKHGHAQERGGRLSPSTIAVAQLHAAPYLAGAAARKPSSRAVPIRAPPQESAQSTGKAQVVSRSGSQEDLCVTREGERKQGNAWSERPAWANEQNEQAAEEARA